MSKSEAKDGVQKTPLYYKEESQPTDVRVQDLLGRMTLAEKLAQLGSAWVYQLLKEGVFDREAAAGLLKEGIGQITRVGGASSLDPEGTARMGNTIQRYLVEETRLGIPAILHEECCSGYMARNATCFPQIIGLASCWQPELAQAMAGVVRLQMRAVGARQGLSPVLDVTRDPRWGRVEETFGEDPYLAALLGVHFVRGLQGESWPERVLATAKHFVGYGQPEGGMNWAPSHIPPRELRETYLFPFEAAVKEAALQSVMNAYHEIDGIPCGASRQLLTGILREEWGFDGLVVSDYFAVEELQRTHRLTDDPGRAAALALEAGIDVELPSTNYYGEPLRQALEQGGLDEALLDRSVARVLQAKFKLGLFEQPYVDVAGAAAVFDTAEQRALAREIARQSFVLLKNDAVGSAPLLPLAPVPARLAVIGPQAGTTRHLLGDYAYPCHIETLLEMGAGQELFNNMPVPEREELVEGFVPIRTILDVLREQLPGATIDYAPGCGVTGDDRSGFAEAVAAAQAADVALLFLGGKSGLTDSCTCGEARDRAELGLSGVQEELLRAVHATGTPVILVLVNGRPLTIPWAADHIPAILEAWLPGEEGAEALVEVLLGQANPGGKLPITWPRHVGQVPIYYGHKPSGGRSHWKGAYVETSNLPQWPFGFGLSYTRFELDGLQLNRAEMGAGDEVEIRVRVTNVGERAGDEVVQLYVRDPIASLTRPVQELKGFKRIHLSPGERRTVTFTLYANQLGFYDQSLEYVLEPGTVEVLVGTSAADLPLAADLEIVGEQREVGGEKRFFSRVATE